LRLAPVISHDSGVVGIIASLSDITRQQELQQTKNDVISLVSHEMRTPLTAIQGMSELLAGYDMQPERRRELNLAINEEAKRLTRMITQYLDITRLEAGATVLRRSAVRIEALTERTLLLLEPLASERGMRLVRDFAPNLPVVLADADLLSRAIENLASNAIKYGAPGTSVEICVRPGADDLLLVEVKDRGAGIAREDIERIFDKFYRAPRAENADVPGTGLGLPLVREIAGLHGGRITVSSNPGYGSVFTLAIPAVKASAM
jgi:signal transduction histidine kinase